MNATDAQAAICDLNRRIVSEGYEPSEEELTQHLLNLRAARGVRSAGAAKSATKVAPVQVNLDAIFGAQNED